MRAGSMGGSPSLALGDLDLGAGPEHPDFIVGRDRDTDGLGPQAGGRIERREQEEALTHAEGLVTWTPRPVSSSKTGRGTCAAVSTQVPSRATASSNAGCDRYSWASPGGLMVHVAPCSAINGSMTSAAGVARSSAAPAPWAACRPLASAALWASGSPKASTLCSVWPHQPAVRSALWRYSACSRGMIFGVPVVPPESCSTAGPQTSSDSAIAS